MSKMTQVSKRVVAKLPTAGNDSTNIGIGTVGTSNLQDLAVTSSKLAPGLLQDSSKEISNLSIAASTSAGQISISVLDKSGVTPTSVSPVSIGFRSLVQTSGLYTREQITSSTSITVPAGAGLGYNYFISQQAYVYMYAVTAGSGIFLAVSGTPVNEGLIQNTKILDSSSNSSDVLYSTSPMSNVSIRIIGRIALHSLAAVWSSISSIELYPFDLPVRPRNAILNGGMDLFQRIESSYSIPSGVPSYCSADRFMTWTSGVVSGASNIKNMTEPIGLRSATSCLEITAQPSVTNSSTGVSLRQRIPSDVILPCCDRVCTLSWLRKMNGNIALNGLLNITISYGSGVNDFTTLTPISTTPNISISDASVWVRESVTFYMPIEAAVGVSVDFFWHSISGASVRHMYITEIMLDSQPFLVPFERAHASADDEISACQRFYEKTFPLDYGSVTSPHSGPAQNSGYDSVVGLTAPTLNQRCSTTWTFKSTKVYAVPTITSYSPNAASANWSTNILTPIYATISTTQQGVWVAATTSAMAGKDYYIHLTAESEI